MANLSSYLPGGIDPAAVTITGGTINGTTIGASTAAAGTFTTFTSNGIDDNADATAITIDSSENVGIGTASPSSNLHVYNGSDAEEQTIISEVSGAHSNGAGISLRRSGTEMGRVNADYFDGLTFHATTGSGGAATERIRIDTSGNLGIGTTSPNNYSNYTTLTINGSGNGAVIDIEKDGTVTGELWVYGGTTDIGLAAAQSTSNLRFFTGGFNERMRIDTSGNVLVATSSTISAGDEGIQLGSNGMISTARNQTSSQTHMAFVNPNGTVGSITTLNNATAFNQSSDERLKENIVDAPAGNIDAIRVRSFDWKADGSHQTYGMVAQELVDVAPEAVTQGETEDDMWGVDYSKLVPMMIKEIQDLKAEVAALKGA